MGRIKSIAIKRLGEELIKEHGKKFSEEFEKNKKALNEVRPIKSKRTRNIVAGYITKKVQQINSSGI